jgi:hypothetical protein
MQMNLFRASSVHNAYGCKSCGIPTESVVVMVTIGASRVDLFSYSWILTV